MEKHLVLLGRAVYSKLLVGLSLLCFSLQAHVEEEVAIQRIGSHILLKDYGSAVSEGGLFYAGYPSSPGIWEEYLRALATLGDEKSMLEVWKEKKEVFSDKALQRRVLETMSWGILQRAFRSASPLLRLHALVGGTKGNDVPGVDFLVEGLRDQQPLIRLAAVELAGHLRDDRLKDEIRRLISRKEREDIRIAAIQSAGKMQMHDVVPFLTDIVADSSVSKTEKAVASEALVHILDKMELKEVEILCNSPHHGLRCLGCMVIAHCGIEEAIPWILGRLQDPHGDVRTAAWETLMCFPSAIQTLPLASLLKGIEEDFYPEVGIAAAKVMLFRDQERGEKAFSLWLLHEQQEVRILAAATLASTGEKGRRLGTEILDRSDDVYVRLNLALGFLPFRIEVEKMGAIVRELLREKRGRWMKKRMGFVTMILPQQSLGDGVVSPEEVNQITRLEILGLLALVESEKAQEAFYAFLEEERWNLSSIAATLLLTEGDEAATECVKVLCFSMRIHVVDSKQH